MNTRVLLEDTLDLLIDLQDNPDLRVEVFGVRLREIKEGLTHALREPVSDPTGSVRADD